MCGGYSNSTSQAYHCWKTWIACHQPPQLTLEGGRPGTLSARGPAPGRSRARPTGAGQALPSYHPLLPDLPARLLQVTTSPLEEGPCSVPRP